jgi:farnesyl-diphosphate farnesyltransferase
LPDPAPPATAVRLDRLLQQSSRTFALSIPRLPQPLQKQVGLGYLVFRIADTLEDEGPATVAERTAALRDFDEQLTRRDCDRIDALLQTWNQHHRPDHAGYAELLRHGAWVCGQLDQIDPAAAGHIRHHVSRTIAGMIEKLESPEEIEDVPGVRRYCYHVAGIVGELLTDLFVHNHPALRVDRAELMQLAESFGEALQLVNILRDQGVDTAAGRRYVPDGEARQQLLDLADAACGRSRRYVALLQQHDAPAGLVEFNGFNLCLAEATLELVRLHGPGVKVGRETVAQVLQSLS